MEGYYDTDGTIRCSNTLELLGYHFEVDGVRYYGLLKDYEKL